VGGIHWPIVNIDHYQKTKKQERKKDKNKRRERKKKKEKRKEKERKEKKRKGKKRKGKKKPLTSTGGLTSSECRPEDEGQKHARGGRNEELSAANAVDQEGGADGDEEVVDG
jgi:hypothetical protein